MSMRLRMYQVLLFKSRCHLCNGSMMIGTLKLLLNVTQICNNWKPSLSSNYKIVTQKHTKDYKILWHVPRLFRFQDTSRLTAPTNPKLIWCDVSLPRRWHAFLPTNVCWTERSLHRKYAVNQLFNMSVDWANQWNAKSDSKSRKRRTVIEFKRFATLEAIAEFFSRKNWLESIKKCWISPKNDVKEYELNFQQRSVCLPLL